MANIIACFLLILIPYAASISFNFTNFSPNDMDKFIFDGGANISEDAIQVTPEVRGGMVSTEGRVTYMEPFHLWDKGSRELARFSTSFTFVKLFNPDNISRQDDGFRFLLNSSEVDSTTNDSGYQYVWVEFDPYCNKWDGNISMCDHVGININSDNSISHARWLNDKSSRRECHVLIEYDSASRSLNVSFTSLLNNRVQHNNLTFPVDLREALPEWVSLGFFAVTGEAFDRNTVKSWMFNSSQLQVDENNRLVAGLIAAGVSFLIALFGIIAFFLWRKKKNGGDKVQELGFSMNHEIEIGPTGPRKFSYLELARATAGFAEKQKLGEGSFGEVYKGFLKDLSTYVAVKRVSKTSKQGIKEYASEVTIISRLRHRNLVQLIGWCHQKGDLLLVYEYMENGSLDTHLYKEKSLLTWGTRYKIAIGLASGLLYLHEEWEKCVLHRDIKSSNVMLDSNFNAKLGDFGLAKFVEHDKGSQTTILAGTLGYIAPECAITGKANKESDVFSFGVVALEIVCGRKSIDYKAQEAQIWLPEWVWELYGNETFLEAVDPRLRSEFDEVEARRLMIVGLWCVHPDFKLRPTMRQVVQVLNSEASLPTLPSNMPVASYFTTPTPSLFDGSNVDLSTSSSYLHGR